MATSTATSNVAPILSWNKTQPQLKPTPRKNNYLPLIGVATIVLLAACGLWRAYHSAASVPFIKVLSASHDVSAGTRLGFTTIRFLDVPKTYVTPDMVTDLNNTAGRIASTFIPAGEPIRSFMLLPGNASLSTGLEIDERAITLQLNDDALVDHSILPNDRVDVLVVSSNKDGKKYTKTLCQAVRVLMTAPKDQMLARHNSNSASDKITLAVGGDLAEALAEASEVGKIRLVLRNRLSRIAHNWSGSDPQDLLPASAFESDKQASQLPDLALAALPPPPAMAPLPIAAAPPTPLQWIVDVFTGSHKDTYGVPAK